MMASGGNRLFTTMSRQMPVLAQSQSGADPCASGGCLPEQTVIGRYMDYDGPAPVVVTASPTFPGISGLMIDQSQSPPAQQTPQWPSYASRGNNPIVGRNIGVGALVGGLGVGVFAAVNIVGFPEVEVGEGIGVVLGGLSALGDPGLIILNFGTYGATAGGIAGYVFTPPQ